MVERHDRREVVLFAAVGVELNRLLRWLLIGRNGRSGWLHGRWFGCRRCSHRRLTIQLVEAGIVDCIIDAMTAELQEMQWTAQMNRRPDPLLCGVVYDFATDLLEFFIGHRSWWFLVGGHWDRSCAGTGG